MHEFALAEEIVAASLQAINTHGGGRLKRVHVVVGERNHIDPDILSDAFTMAAAGTDAAAAVLNVETPPNLCAACDVDSMVPTASVAVTAIEVAD
jgi:Zn finger protein HypA/HybF involved in hydrogenase expression